MKARSLICLRQTLADPRAARHPRSPWPVALVIALVAMMPRVLPAQAAGGGAPAVEALNGATELADQIRQQTAGAPPAARLPSGDPCAILPLAIVQKAFPGAKAGERSRRLEQYGSTECGWKDAKGVVLVAVQESFSSGSAVEDVEGMAMGFTDPLNPQARKNVKLEKFQALGADAAAFVERQDPARGILSDGAMLSVRRGDHTVWVMTNQLSRRDRAAALKTLEELGQAAARRL